MHYQGSCHCGRVRYELDADLSRGTVRCNCSFCAKVRNWSFVVKPAAFRLTTGEDQLSDYGFKPESVNRHVFCKTCGVRIATRGYVEQMGGDFVSVSIATIDNLSDQELAALPIRYLDGLHDIWTAPPPVVSYL